MDPTRQTTGQPMPHKAGKPQAAACSLPPSDSFGSAFRPDSTREPDRDKLVLSSRRPPPESTRQIRVSLRNPSHRRRIFCTLSGRRLHEQQVNDVNDSARNTTVVPFAVEHFAVRRNGAGAALCARAAARRGRHGTRVPRNRQRGRRRGSVRRDQGAQRGVARASTSADRAEARSVTSAQAIASECRACPHVRARRSARLHRHGVRARRDARSLHQAAQGRRFAQRSLANHP